MSKILVITDTDRDYAADFLAHGFVAAGHEVIDYPRKESLHWTAEPVMDCDVNLPEHSLGATDVAQRLSDGYFDLIVVPTLRGLVRGQLLAWDRAGLLQPNRDIIVAVDGEDHAHNTRYIFDAVLGGTPAAYFKRELPFDARWARPLPFGYPTERVVPVGTKREGVAYTAHLWDWCGPDSMRGQLSCVLNSPHDRHIRPVRQRLSVNEDHALHQRSLIAVSPAGMGYHTNRHLQVVADGCCPVIEAPWMQWPNAPVDGTQCRYFKSAVQCIDIVEELLDEPEQATDMARQAQSNLLAHHTTQCRAETVWRSIYER